MEANRRDVPYQSLIKVWLKVSASAREKRCTFHPPRASNSL